MAGVLISDGMQRKSLAAVRALGRTGHRVVAAEWTAFAAALFSRYASRARSEPAGAGEAALARSVARICDNRDLDVVLAMEESTLLALKRNPSVIPEAVALPFPDLSLLELARDKSRLLKVAQGLDIPIPHTVHPEQVGSGALPDGPLVVKPCVGSGAVGVRYARSADEAMAHVEAARARGQAVVVQERLPREGEGVGVSVLMGEGGAVHALFTHRRLREFPVSGGASTLRESHRDRQAEAATVRLLGHLGWRGIAMVEFKRDLRDGSLKLLEVNPRFWGSLSLAVAAGVNFPDLLVRGARGETLPGPPRYKTGVRARWLLPGDLMHFFANPARWRLAPSFWRFFDKNLHYDVLDPSDPLPALGTLLSAIPFMADPDLRRFLRR